MKLRIAIIEDEYYTRQAIRKYIEKLGDPYEFCGEAGDGKEGLELLRSQRPEIALVDITMPIMNGIDMMQQAFDESLPTRMIILTGYSEFTYARAAVRLGVDDYLLKPLRIEDLRRTLERVNRKILRQPKMLPDGIALENLLSSQLAEQLTRSGAESADTSVLLEHLSFPQNTGTYYVALLEFHSESPAANILCELSARSQKPLREQGFPVASYNIDVNAICLVINTPVGSASEELHQALTCISDSIHETFGVSLKISLSCGCSSLSMIHDAYLESQVVRQYYMFNHSKNTALYTTESLISSPCPLFDSKMRHTFSMLLRRRDAKLVKSFIRERFDALTHANATSIYLCAAEIMSIILEYTATHADIKENMDTPLSMLPSLFSINHVDSLRDYVIEQALSAVGSAESGQNAHSPLIRRVHEYIDQNFSNSALRLEDVARANFISTQYLCSVYRHATGHTVGDYIFDVRMYHAQQLIKNNQRNVTAISEACGYDDPNYFSKCFRKKFGMTPKQYIESQPL